MATSPIYSPRLTWSITCAGPLGIHIGATYAPQQELHLTNQAAGMSGGYCQFASVRLVDGNAQRARGDDIQCLAYITLAEKAVAVLESDQLGALQKALDEPVVK